MPGGRTRCRRRRGPRSCWAGSRVVRPLACRLQSDRGMTLRPERYRNAVVPHIYVDGASDGIAFYKRAFGAVELFRIARPDGKILHAEISICGSVVMIGDPDDKLYAEPRTLGRCTAGLHLFPDDNEALLRRAVEAG